MSISSIIDIGIVLIILVSAGISFFRGFVREVLTIFGVIGGAMAAYLFGSKVAPVIRGWFGEGEGQLFGLISYDIAAQICAYAGIFIAVFLILQLISYFMSASIRAIGLGPVDRTLGVVFGIARALLFLGIIYMVLASLIPDENKKEILGKSKTIVYIEAVSDWLKGFMPNNETSEGTGNAARDKLREIQAIGGDAATRAQEQVDELKKAADKLPAYSDEERKSLNQLIETETDNDPALPERSPPNE